MTRRQRGFTLTELLVAVLLVGVLAALGIFYLRARPRAIDVAASLSARIAEASRKAVTYGAVRKEVSDNLGIRYRTRAVLTVAARGGTLVIDRLEEHPPGDPGADWVRLATHTIDSAVRIAGTRERPDLTGGASSPEVPAMAGTTIQLDCYPDGRCVRAGTTDQGLTIYLTSVEGRRTARVVVLPLGGAPATFDGW